MTKTVEHTVTADSYIRQNFSDEALASYEGHPARPVFAAELARGAALTLIAWLDGVCLRCHQRSRFGGGKGATP